MYKEISLGTEHEIHQLIPLKPLQEKILFAEKHGKNYDIYFSVKYDPSLEIEKLITSLQYVMNKIEMFRCTIVKQGNTYYFNKEVLSEEIKFSSEQTLKNQKIDVLNGDPLAQYYIMETERKIEFLFHHLVFDNDALPIFLAKLEKHLMTGEWIEVNTKINEKENGLAIATEYFSTLRKKIKPQKELELDFESGYMHSELPKELYLAVSSLSSKLKLTKFGVLFYALMLVSGYAQHFIGVVTSRKDKLRQQQVINNYTDVVPIAIEIDRKMGCNDQAMKCFKEMFSAIYQSEYGTFQQYMEVLGQKKYDYIISYTKMEEEKFQLFKELELGTYLYKFDDHFQFNEYKDHITMECRYSNNKTKRVYEKLEEILFTLDRIDLTKPFVSLQGEEYQEIIEKVDKKEVYDFFRNRKDQDLLFDSGISSLEIAQIITESYEQWGIQLSYQDVYGMTTFGELKEMIRNEVNSVKQKCVLENHKSRKYKVPEHIKPMFIDSFRFFESEMYNIKYAMKLSEAVCRDLPTFKQAVEEVVSKNDVFFTKFIFSNGEIIGSIATERIWELETIEVSNAEELLTIESKLTVHSEQNLWDLKIVTIRNQKRDAYLFFNVHHMLIDDIGINILLTQIESVFRKDTVEYIQYQQIEQGYDTAIQKALDSWTEFIPTDGYKNIGKDGLSRGIFHKYQFKIPMENMAFERLEPKLLNSLLQALAEFFQEDKLYIGAMYHGRVYPYTDRIVYSFARVLPLHFNRKNSQLLKYSLRQAKENQAVSMYDLNKVFSNLEFPKIIYQTLVTDKKESAVVTEMTELAALTKFQIFFNTYAEKETIIMDTYIDPEIYSPKEEQKLIGLLSVYVENNDLQEVDKN